MFLEVNTKGPFEFTVSVCAYFKTSAVTDGLVDVCLLWKIRTVSGLVSSVCRSSM